MREPIIGNQQEYDAKVAEFIGAGKSSVYVLSDFDNTLTHEYVNGEHAPAIVGEISKGEHISKRHAQEDHRMYKKYRAMELDPNLSLEEKTQAMEEWWRAHMNVMIEEKAQRQMFINAAKDSMQVFRDYADELFQFTEKENIPFVVFSAGLAEMIRVLFEDIDIPTEHTFIVSNELAFDENEMLTGYAGDIIHIFNKNMIGPDHVEGLAKELEGRTHVIVMGDSLGDLPMMERFPHDHVLKIGFHNHLNDDILHQHVEGFDIVIPDNGDLKVPLELLRQIR